MTCVVARRCSMNMESALRQITFSWGHTHLGYSSRHCSKLSFDDFRGLVSQTHIWHLKLKYLKNMKLFNAQHTIFLSCQSFHFQADQQKLARTVLPTVHGKCKCAGDSKVTERPIVIYVLLFLIDVSFTGCYWVSSSQYWQLECMFWRKIVQNGVCFYKIFSTFHA